MFCFTKAIPLRTLSGEFQQCSDEICNQIKEVNFLYSQCSNDHNELTVSYTLNGKIYYGVLLADSTIVESSCYFDDIRSTKTGSERTRTKPTKKASDTETKFFNSTNWLFGFIDDIYDYIFWAWIIINNIVLGLGIKFKNGTSQNNINLSQDYVPASPSLPQDNVPLSSASHQDNVPLPLALHQDNAPLLFTSHQDIVPLPSASIQDNVRLPFASHQDIVPLPSASIQDNLNLPSASNQDYIPGTSASHQDNGLPSYSVLFTNQQDNPPMPKRTTQSNRQPPEPPKANRQPQPAKAKSQPAKAFTNTKPCNCKSNLHNNGTCHSNICSCKKNNIKCTSLCHINHRNICKNYLF
jgi:hypothetical protein